MGFLSITGGGLTRQDKAESRAKSIKKVITPPKTLLYCVAALHYIELAVQPYIDNFSMARCKPLLINPSRRQVHGSSVFVNIAVSQRTYIAARVYRYSNHHDAIPVEKIPEIDGLYYNQTMTR